MDKSVFSLFPASVVLEPGQSRAVRLSWRGSAKVERELAYRILAEQVPVDFAAPAAEGRTDQVNIDIFLRYLGAVYVKPAGAAPDIAAAVERTGDPGRVNLVVENRGTGHVVLKNLRVALSGSGTGGSAAYEVGQDQLAALSNANMLAGSRRVHPVTLPPDFPEGPLSADIEFETP